MTEECVRKCRQRLHDLCVSDMHTSVLTGFTRLPLGVHLPELYMIIYWQRADWGTINAEQNYRDNSVQN